MARWVWPPGAGHAPHDAGRHVLDRVHGVARKPEQRLDAVRARVFDDFPQHREADHNPKGGGEAHAELEEGPPVGPLSPATYRRGGQKIMG